ncbi:MAG: hypothetical protein LBT80_01665 [Lactobacillaceae bacterium]|nr:hypothetical protein [Lactobacillaceae bacterium]
MANNDLDLVEILNEGKVVIDYPAGNKRGRQWTPGQQIEATMYALRYNNPGLAYDEIRINDRTRWRRRS